MLGKRTSDSPSGQQMFKQTKLSFAPPPSQRKKEPKPDIKPALRPGIQNDKVDKNASTASKEPERTVAGPSSNTNLIKNTPIPKPISTSGNPTPSPAIVNPNPKRTLRVVEKAGDLFDAPPNTVLIHACNTQGSWGGGIALAFKQRYREAYKMYRMYCQASGTFASRDGDLVGKARLIAADNGTQHWIGCLFTSKRHGRARDSPGAILAATGPAMQDLLKQIARYNKRTTRPENRIGELRMCRINSGLFGVPWERSKAVLEGIEVDEVVIEVTAYSLD
ncbi:hypothetical protein QBC46DRAFT_279844 [Diplogelasinospora grovesii]|uniref:ADP-ribose 1''-phosphate phosphatase n=1 Tax=Diplogelasinospora grovesii TaxID=303347 RepID=A0AAN6NG60_9PEZI|nr:hypothetical protein QBC46DRAFT_279844 [Diplogelasinospora grovesii]